MQLNSYLFFNANCETRFGMLADRFGIPWMVNCESSGSEA
jgi:uncharacterized glyoxalase superfamily protein PhnB